MDVDTPRQVGKSRMHISPLGLGCGILSRAFVSNEEATRTITSAWQSGVRHFDTAPWYGVGRSERRLGVALFGVEGADKVPPRDSYTINTKVGRTLNPEPVHNPANDLKSPGGQPRTLRDPLSGFRVAFDYSYDAIRRQHWDSLQRLGQSRVDSLTIHDICYGYHSPEAIEAHLTQLSRDGGGGARALEEMREEGAISAIGCGVNLDARNAFSWEDNTQEDLCDRIADLVDLDFFVISGGYTLLETRALRRLLPLCESRDIGVIIAAPYASGWLVAPNDTATYMYDKPSDDIVKTSRAMQAICEDAGVPLAAAAIQFPLAHPNVAGVIPGAKHPQEPVQNQVYLNTPVPVSVWQKMKDEGLLDEHAPTPDADPTSPGV